MRINEGKVVLNFKETPRENQGSLSGGYPHIVRDKVFWRLAHPKEIAYAVEKNGKYEKPTNNILLKNSLAAENFKVFYDTKPGIPEEERYKAVGGYHTGKHPMLKDCSFSKGLNLTTYPNPVWSDEPKPLFDDDFFHPRHANGLYVFVSSDGINWKEYSQKPVLSVFRETLDEDGRILPKGTLGFDWMPSVFYDHNVERYVIYLRANISLGCRAVFYSYSDDLLSWTTPRLIKCDPEFDKQNKQNFYYPGIYPLGKKYISFTPHFYNLIINPDGSDRLYLNECTKVMVSDNGTEWKVVDGIFKVKMNKHMYQPHVVTFREENGMHVIYTNEGWQTQNSRMIRYEVDLGGLFE